jgi:hypothetical protein
MTNFKACITFFLQLQEVLKDKKVTFSEGIGIMPELFAFLAVFKDLDGLKREIDLLEDKFGSLDPDMFQKFLTSEGIEITGTKANSLVQAVSWIIHFLRSK